MRIESMVEILIDINEKLEKSDEQKDSMLYYEVLHSSLFALVGEFTEKQYKLIQLPIRMTIEKLDKEILRHCSRDYQQAFNDHIKSKGRFKEEQSKANNKKNKIGFCSELEEGTTV